jgi:hypothetical protein
MTQEHVTPAGTSVLDELGLDADFVVKAKLAIRIQKAIADGELAQREGAAHSNQPAVQPEQG